MRPEELFRIIITRPDGSRLVAGEHLSITEAVYLRERLICWGIPAACVEPERAPEPGPSYCSRILDSVRRLRARLFRSSVAH